MGKYAYRCKCGEIIGATDVPDMEPGDSCIVCRNSATQQHSGSDILQEALDITDTGHSGAYPPWDKESENVCLIMNTLYPDLDLSPEQFTMLMIVLKQTRESHKHKRDNLVDLAGYTNLLASLYKDGKRAAD